MRYLTILIVIILYSCNSEPIIEDEVKVIDNQIQEKEAVNAPVKFYAPIQIDSIINKMEDVYLYEYPNLTRWGGISTFYYRDTLIKIETQNNAELGYVTQNYYVKNDSIIRIVQISKTPNWFEFEQNYPDLDAVENENKMNYRLDTFGFNLKNNVRSFDASNTTMSEPLSDNLVQSGYEVLEFIDTNSQDFIVVYD